MNPNETPDIANLLEHSAWLRRLAGHLVSEPEDSIQDVWLAALRAPPDANRPPQPWLSRVLQNASHRRHRDAALRRENEQRAAPEPIEDVPTPEELVSRAETQRLLAELVLGLSEPFRRVVLLRYFEGLSAAEIARALGVPAGTVRWQLKEGIDRLRDALDSRFGNDRHAWMLAFAPLAAVPRGSATIGVGLMTAKVKIAAILVPLLVLALMGVAWRAGFPTASPSREHTALPSSGLSRPVAAANQHAGGALPAATLNPVTPPMGSSSSPTVEPSASTVAGRDDASAPNTRFWNLPRVTDRRPNRPPVPGPHEEQLQESLGYAFQTLDEDAARCLGRAARTGSGESGELMVAFGISKHGLGKVWMVDGGAELPTDQQSCFTNAVQAQDWSNIVDEPLEVTKRFDLAHLRSLGGDLQ